MALIDAQIELGRYDAAGIEVDRLIDQRVGVAALSRLSYLRQLQGDSLGAEAAMANRFVDELRRITSLLALTEAQQRRVFFEAQVKLTRDNLTKAQLSLQTSGFNPGALKAEPKAAAENYARMRAEVTAAEVRLETLRRNLADMAPEVLQQQTRVGALRAALSKLETSTDSVNEPGYVGKYREFKYQETLFELFSRQYELARVDESREGALVQVVDVASPPERKTKPKRGMIAVVTTLLTLGLALGFVVLRHLWRQAASDPMTAHKLELLRGTFRRGRTG